MLPSSSTSEDDEIAIYAAVQERLTFWGQVPSGWTLFELSTSTKGEHFFVAFALYIAQSHYGIGLEKLEDAIYISDKTPPGNFRLGIKVILNGVVKTHVFDVTGARRLVIDVTKAKKSTPKDHANLLRLIPDFFEDDKSQEFAWLREDLAAVRNDAQVLTLGLDIPGYEYGANSLLFHPYFASFYSGLQDGAAIPGVVYPKKDGHLKVDAGSIDAKLASEVTTRNASVAAIQTALASYDFAKAVDVTQADNWINALTVIQDWKAKNLFMPDVYQRDIEKIEQGKQNILAAAKSAAATAASNAQRFAAFNKTITDIQGDGNMDTLAKLQAIAAAANTSLKASDDKTIAVSVVNGVLQDERDAILTTLKTLLRQRSQTELQKNPADLAGKQQQLSNLQKLLDGISKSQKTSETEYAKILADAQVAALVKLLSIDLTAQALVIDLSKEKATTDVQAKIAALTTEIDNLNNAAATPPPAVVIPPPAVVTPPPTVVTPPPAVVTPPSTSPPTVVTPPPAVVIPAPTKEASSVVTKLAGITSEDVARAIDAIAVPAARVYEGPEEYAKASIYYEQQQRPLEARIARIQARIR